MIGERDDVLDSFLRGGVLEFLGNIITTQTNKDILVLFFLSGLLFFFLIFFQRIAFHLTNVITDDDRCKETTESDIKKTFISNACEMAIVRILFCIFV